jgi:nitrite reductase/ring-hydroxylating ferredoxin subunit
MAVEHTPVLALADLPVGSLAYVEIEGLPIALANVDGVIYAVGDSCRHEGGSLASGVLIGTTVTCPWHGWVYDLRTGKSVVPPVGLRVPTYPVSVADGQIYLDLDWDA